MKLHRISNGEMPPENRHILVYCENASWYDGDEDHEKSGYKSYLWRVAKYVKGISTAEREEMKRSSDPQKLKRANTYCGNDEWGNNKVPYWFEEFGDGSFFGQDIDIWCELPKVRLEDNEVKYEFKVGDYVKMTDGRVGFVEALWNLGTEQKIRISMNDGNTNHIYCTNNGYMKLSFNSAAMFDFHDYFKRIGKYDFTEKKNKIEPLELRYDYPILGIDNMRDKINEIISYINKNED